MTHIPLFKKSPQMLLNEPFLAKVGTIVGLIKRQITAANGNSFFYIASDGKQTNYGRAGQESDIILGLATYLDSDSTARDFIIKFLKEKYGVGAEQKTDNELK